MFLNHKKADNILEILKLINAANYLEDQRRPSSCLATNMFFGIRTLNIFSPKSLEYLQVRTVENMLNVRTR